VRPQAAEAWEVFMPAQDSLQVFSLQGPNHLEFSAARDASAAGAGCHRRQPAGVSKATPTLGARRAAHRLAHTCMMLTFLTLAPGLTPVRYEASRRSLENVEGKYRFTEVTVRPRGSCSGALSTRDGAVKPWTCVEVIASSANPSRQSYARPGLVLAPPPK